MAADHIKQDRRVFHRLSNRTDLIKTGTKSNKTIARDATVSGLHADHAAKRGGLTDRTAGIASERREGHVRRNRSRRTAARTARHAFQVPGIPAWTERGGFA